MSKAELAKERLLDMIINGELSDTDLVDIIILVSGGIGARKFTDAAKEMGMTYSGAMKSPKLIKFRIANVLFAMENRNSKTIP
jgi:hypothetical protein